MSILTITLETAKNAVQGFGAYGNSYAYSFGLSSASDLCIRIIDSPEKGEPLSVVNEDGQPHVSEQKQDQKDAQLEESSSDLEGNKSEDQQEDQYKKIPFIYTLHALSKAYEMLVRITSLFTEAWQNSSSFGAFCIEWLRFFGLTLVALVGVAFALAEAGVTLAAHLAFSLPAFVARLSVDKTFTTIVGFVLFALAALSFTPVLNLSLYTFEMLALGAVASLWIAFTEAPKYAGKEADKYTMAAFAKDGIRSGFAVAMMFTAMYFGGVVSLLLTAVAFVLVDNFVKNDFRNIDLVRFGKGSVTVVELNGKNDPNKYPGQSNLLNGNGKGRDEEEAKRQARNDSDNPNDPIVVPRIDS